MRYSLLLLFMVAAQARAVDEGPPPPQAPPVVRETQAPPQAPPVEKKQVLLGHWHWDGRGNTWFVPLAQPARSDTPVQEVRQARPFQAAKPSTAPTAAQPVATNHPVEPAPGLSAAGMPMGVIGTTARSVGIPGAISALPGASSDCPT